MIVSSNVQQRFRTYWSAYKTAPWVFQRSGGKSVSSISSILVSALVCDKENTHTICMYIYIYISISLSLSSCIVVVRVHAALAHTCGTIMNYTGNNPSIIYTFFPKRYAARCWATCQQQQP